MTTHKELAVVQKEERSLAVPSSFNIEDIFRYAIENKGTAETLEKLMGIRRELNAESAQKAFDTAMAELKAELPIIIKERGVPTATGSIAYHYAPIEAIEIQIRPFLKKYGFSHTFDTDTASADGWVIAKCIVTHSQGHSRVSTAKFPLGTKTQIMSATQVFAAALTFANRRALCNAYGLVVAGEDVDGATGKMKPQGPSSLRPAESGLKALAQELWNVLKPVRGAEQNWNEANQWLWRQEILDAAAEQRAPDLSPAQFRVVIEKAKKVLA